MRNPLTRATTALRDIVSGRRALARYSASEAHRRSPHNRDANLAHHYIPPTPPGPMSGPGGM